MTEKGLFYLPMKSFSCYNGFGVQFKSYFLWLGFYFIQNGFGVFTFIVSHWRLEQDITKWKDSRRVLLNKKGEGKDEGGR